ncbi:MAG: GNAT family protein [Anaerolineaceae bacterium]|nr:GNAT family protein [Anaerolineaceae bacterium]
MRKLFEGDLVRLAAYDKEKDVELEAKWVRDSDYMRLLDDMPGSLYSIKQVQEWIEGIGGDQGFYAIRTLADDKYIGTISLGGFAWTDRNAWVGIGIGDRDYWGKGYGSDAMKVLLHYAFTELNLHRVNLSVFSFNERAIKSYEKSGFKYEGTQREAIYKEDQRWDIITMGILQSEWQAMQE